MGKSKFKKGLSLGDSPFFAYARPKMWIGQIEHEGTKMSRGMRFIRSEKAF